MLHIGIFTHNAVWAYTVGEVTALGEHINYEMSATRALLQVPTGATRYTKPAQSPHCPAVEKSV